MGQPNAPQALPREHRPVQASVRWAVRVVATRYDKLTVRYEATVHIAAINEWLLPTS
jgi:hypothetical protein